MVQNAYLDAWGVVPPQVENFVSLKLESLLLGTSLDQAMSKKKKNWPDWPKFCILGEILVNILLESLIKIIWKYN